MTGEQRHEQCRHGVFSAHSVRVDERGRETPFAMPLCAWSPERSPPALDRAWGGAIDMDRDCAACPVWSPLP